MQATFKVKPLIKIIDGGKAQLTSPMEFLDDKARTWVVPSGFVTDFASVPKLVPGVIRLFLPAKLESALAAVLHDYLYATGLVSRREADRLFELALKVSGEGIVGSSLMWLGVRVGGFVAWRRHKKARNGK